MEARRVNTVARHLVVVAEERAQAATLAHQSAVASNVQSLAGPSMLTAMRPLRVT